MKKRLVDPLSIMLGVYAFLIGVVISLLFENSSGIVRGFIDAVYSASLILLLFMRRRYTVKELCIFVTTILLFSIAGYHTRRIHMLTYALFLINALYCRSFSQVAKAVMIGVVASRLFVAFLAIIGILPNMVFWRRGEVEGYGLGYNYVWQVPYGMLFSFMSYMYMKGKSLSLLEILVSLTVNQLVFMICRARLVYYLWFFAVLMYIFIVKFKWVKKYGKIVTIGLVVSFPLLAIVTLLLGYNYNGKNPIVFFLNDILSQRLVANNVALKRFPITIFGQFIETNTSPTLARQYFYLDSGYLFTLLGYGVVVLLIVLFMYCYLSWYACKIKDPCLVIWLMVVALFTFSNNGWVYLEFNCILIAFPMAWRKQLRPSWADDDPEMSDIWPAERLQADPQGG